MPPAHFLPFVRIVLLASVVLVPGGCAFPAGADAGEEEALDVRTRARLETLPAIKVWATRSEDAYAPPPSTLIPSADFAPFLDAAHKANAIADPLARCLAFPDLPGNHWPAGLAQAHCEYTHGPHVDLDGVRAYLDRGDHQGLDARFAADLARHFDDDDFSEVIHRDFEAFDESAGVDEVTRRWLAAAPDSPYALAARGSHLLEMAGKTRGDRYTQDTSDEAMEGMGDYAAQAASLLERALALEPRLMPAYQDQLGIAQLTSDDALGDAAFAAANRHDDKCRFTTGWRIAGLSPLWGGSYARMDALAATLEPHVAERPLLAHSTVWPDVVRAQWHDHEPAGIDVHATIAPRTTNPRAYLELVHALQGASGIEFWQIAVLLMEVERFAPPLEPQDARLLMSVLKYGPRELEDDYVARLGQPRAERSGMEPEQR